MKKIFLQVALLLAGSTTYAETYCAPQDGGTETSGTCNNSAAFIAFGAGYHNIASSVKTENLKTTNTAAEFIGNPAGSIENPNFDTGASLSLENQSETSNKFSGNGALFQLAFGYTAPISNKFSLIANGTFELSTASSAVNVIRTFNEYEMPVAIDATDLDNVEENSGNLNGKIRSNLNFGPNFGFGYSLTEDTTMFVTFGYNCQRQSTSTTGLDANGDEFNATAPYYLHGFKTSIGAEKKFDRIAVGVLGSYTIYGSRKATVITYQNNETATNTATELGYLPVTQTLEAEPLSNHAFGVLAYVKVLFSDR